MLAEAMQRRVAKTARQNLGFRQIKDLPDSYLAIDDTEIGFGNKIPLWLFGFCDNETKQGSPLSCAA